MRERFMTSIYPMVYRILMTIVLIAMVLLGVGSRCGIPQCTIWHWLVALWYVMLLAVVNYANKMVKIISILVMVIGISALLPVFIAGSIGEFWNNYLAWMVSDYSFCEEWTRGYEFIQVVWISISCYILQIVTYKNRLLKEILAVCVLLGLLVCMFLKINIHRTGMIFCLIYSLITYVEGIRLKWVKKKIHDARLYLLYLTPFLLLYMIMLSKAPVREEPYDWKAVKDIYYNFREKAIIWWEDITRNNREDFGFATTGFSEDGELYGEVEESVRHIMTVKGSPGLVTNIYLRGKTYDTFTGREWMDTSEGRIQEYPQDVIENMYAVKRYDEERYKDYLSLATLDIRYEHFNTGYLFAPAKTTEIRNATYGKDGSDFLFDEKKGYATEYEVSFYQMNLQSEEFQEFLKSCAYLQEDEEILQEVIGMLPIEARHSFSVTDLQNYRQSIWSEYRREISLSLDVQEYLRELTKNCTTQWERLKAIEKELSGFEYNTHPGKLPEEVDTPQDYLDYFLLESKKGYCAHYATAFVLLAQAEGFPARYVEGICIPLEKNRSMEVSSNRSHAWPEVYLEGFGWVAFEPTPGYAGFRYDGWKIEKREEKTEEKQESIEPSVPMVTESPEVITKEITDIKVEHKARERLQLLGKAILVILLICLVGFIVQKVINRYRYKRLGTEERFLLQYKKNMWILTGMGYKRSESETLDELQLRIYEAIPEVMEYKKGFVFMKDYQEYVYAGKEITAKMLEECKQEGEALLIWIKDKNKWYYLALCLVLWIRN
ncbi:MAG: transglutaminase domain-containing protein [Lachnospiraceae bacterium]|nr:transglutaminase domain-containing protein [Lachnospiraceae bacterium]